MYKRRCGRAQSGSDLLMVLIPGLNFFAGHMIRSPIGFGVANGIDKGPRHIVFSEIPKTSTGKIQKFVLRDWAKKG